VITIRSVGKKQSQELGKTNRRLLFTIISVGVALSVTSTAFGGSPPPCVTDADCTPDDADCRNGQRLCVVGVCTLVKFRTCSISGAPCTTSCPSGAGTCGGTADPRICRDAFSCTTDSCDTSGGDAGTCDNVQVDDNCGDGVACNGEETCDPDEAGHDPVTGCKPPDDRTPCADDEFCCERDSNDPQGNENCCELIEVCDPADGCRGCETDAECVYGPPCTRGRCVPETTATGNGMTCVYDPIMCQPAAPPCEGGERCDPATDLCVPLPDAPFSTGCEADGQFCTQDHCNGLGQCIFLRNVTCPGPTGPCDGGERCNPTNGLCEPLLDPAESTPCEADGSACTTDHCNGDGSCVLLRDKDCSAQNSKCTLGKCNPITADCYADPIPDCCDGDEDCTAFSNKCALGKCDLSTNMCYADPIAGCCDGVEDCTPLNSSCSVGKCDLATNTCFAEPIPNCCDEDADCDDGFSCTNNDHCSMGIHTCFYPRDDAACDDGLSCTSDGCNPTSDGTDPITGCVHGRHDDRCDDGKSCTTDGCNPDIGAAGTGCFTSRHDERCEDGDPCTPALCNPDNAPPDSTTGCQVVKPDPSCCDADEDCPPDTDPCIDNFCDLSDNTCKTTLVENCRDRVSISQKGSLLIYPKIELKWDASGKLKQDTFLTIVNDHYEGVHVQWYFINGDEPTDPVVAGTPPVVIERRHKGWNWVDCPMYLTGDDTGWLSMATGRGGPLDPTCSPFTITDPGSPPGRPDPDGPPGHRVLRGYAIAFAIDSRGSDIPWNHLSGGADLVNYSIPEAWEYNAYAFQAASRPNNEVPHAVAGNSHGELHLDGLEYDLAFDKLLFDFFAVGSRAFSNGGAVVTLDTDLTLFPVDVDLRQDSRGPVTTKAHFDIWNENEDGRSGTTRCITCWDQALISTYEDDNHFLIANLQTNKGKARINGVESDMCDEECDWRWECEDPDENPGLPFPECGWEWHCEIRSKDAALLGVQMKLLAFSGMAGGRALAGSTLVGQGEEDAKIKFDILQPPDTATDPIADVEVGIDGIDVEEIDAARSTETHKARGPSRPTRSE